MNTALAPVCRRKPEHHAEAMSPYTLKPVPYHPQPAAIVKHHPYPLSILLPFASVVPDTMTSRPKRNRPSYAEIFQPIFSDEEKIVANVIEESDSEPGSVFDPAVDAEGGYEAESPSDEELDDLVDEKDNGTNIEEEDSGAEISMGNIRVG